MLGRWMGRCTVAAVWLWTVGACHREVVVEKPRVLAAERLTLEYPQTWHVVSQQGRNEGLFMGIHDVVGSASARVFITIYDAGAPFAAEDVATMHLNALPDALADKPVTETRRVPVTADVGGRSVTGLAVHFTVLLGGRAVPYTVQAFTVQTKTRTGTIVTQVADSDIAQEAGGLTRVLRSLTILPSPASGTGIERH